tara:strand:- start:3762 stop:5591 length:1830 start_codon:yes stop_codon:yes gene_type:complete
MAKICICTTPIRDYPSTCPPFSAMAIIQAFQDFGEDPEFFHMDYFRPSDDEIIMHFKENKYDIVGISSIVSTSYCEMKKLAQIIRSSNPDTVIIIGGHIVASAKVILNKTDADFCVVGDGEIIIKNLFDAILEQKLDDDTLLNIKGISFIDSNGEFRFTGWGQAPDAGEIRSTDFSILEKIGCLDYYFPKDNSWLDLSYRQNDPNSNFPFSGETSVEDIKKMKSASVISSRGCVAKCTFCHRLEKGYKARPSDIVINHIRHLKDDHNIGIIDFQDENFGSNKKVTNDLVKALGEMGLVWRVGGVRSRTITLDTLKFWKENGCVRVSYGIESGSPKMLSVMQKGISAEQNYNGIKWAYEAGITVNWIKLVIGMPGEDDNTIQETIDFCIKSMPYYADVFRKKSNLESSIYYAQALPGTPLYEYLRENGYIKKTLESEEQYLFKISNIDASSTDHFINYTQQPMLKVISWKYWINWVLYRHHAKNNLGLPLGIKVINLILKNKIKQLFKSRIKLKENSHLPSRENSKHEEELTIKNSIFLLIPWNKLTYPIIVIFIAMKRCYGLLHFFKLLFDHFVWSLNVFRKLNFSNLSLRKTVKVVDQDESLLLRLGR